MSAKPGFIAEYVRPETIAEADADLAEMVGLSLRMAVQAQVMHGGLQNARPAKWLLEEVAHHLMRAQSLVRQLREGGAR